MDNLKLLKPVKDMLGISGNFQDDTIKGYIDDVVDFMLGAGVSETIMDSTSSHGAVARGVADLWNYGMGNTSFSPYFLQRVTQLCYRKGGDINE